MSEIIGILGIQGSFKEHEKILHTLNKKTLIVKHKDDFKNIDRLIIPGGESSSILKGILSLDLLDELEYFIQIDKKPVFGTCAGAILLAKTITAQNGTCSGFLPVLDITIERNAYGRQINSSIEKCNLDIFGMYNCMFIRAPQIINYNINYKIFGTKNNNPIMLQKNNILICTFHPELENTKIHEYFLTL